MAELIGRATIEDLLTLLLTLQPEDRARFIRQARLRYCAGCGYQPDKCACVERWRP
jgi:hypothetical protein